MKLLSLDPSLTCTGWAVWNVSDCWREVDLEDFDNIKTCPEDAGNDEDVDNDRLWYISESINKIIKDCDIEQVVYEKDCPYNYTGRGRGQKNMDKYRRAVTYIYAHCTIAVGRKNVYGVFADTWKGTEKKHATIKNVNSLYGLDLKKKDNDIADAIAVGHWFIKRQRIPQKRISYNFTG